jgi:hypothetical protein
MPVPPSRQYPLGTLCRYCWWQFCCALTLLVGAAARVRSGILDVLCDGDADDGDRGGDGLRDGLTGLTRDRDVPADGFAHEGLRLFAGAGCPHDPWEVRAVGAVLGLLIALEDDL